MIQLKNAVKIYGQGTAQTRALNGVNFQVARGEFVAVMGPSGSGKSTLLHIIGCLDGLTEGSFLLDGQELYGKKERELHKYRKKYISYVFQDFALMEDYTIQENIEFPLEIQNVPRRERHKRAEAILKKLKIEEIASKYPPQCSGGQKQRAAIARAFTADTPIFLADEPTGALDSENSHALMAMIQELHREGKTIVLITHEREIAEYADRIVLIRDGILYEEGENADDTDDTNHKRNSQAMQEA